uniref:B9 domain-containing protein 1 n=1 Tax=Romanomermis culicivorax TaxID=13658 RepID=A0A915JL71_ROMCU
MSGSVQNFIYLANGQIENAEFPHLQTLYLKYLFVTGADWSIISGIEEGITQVCRTNEVSNHKNNFVINFPFEIGFKSTNPFGWPQIVLCCYGSDFFGNDVIRGYGACHIPISAGSHKTRIPMFVPDSSSIVQRFLGWLLSRRPELINPSSIAKAENREAMHMKTQGFVDVVWNIVTKDTKKLAFDLNPKSLSLLSDFPLQLPTTASALPPPRLGIEPANPVEEIASLNNNANIENGQPSEQPSTSVELFRASKETVTQNENEERETMSTQNIQMIAPAVPTNGQSTRLFRPEKMPRNKRVMDTVDEISEEKDIQSEN